MIIPKQSGSPFSLAQWGPNVDAAHRRIHDLVTETPVEDVTALFPGAAGKVLCKMENLQLDWLVQAAWRFQQNPVS